VCCREKTLAQAGSLQLGDKCENDSECESGNCNNTYINNVGDMVYLGANYFVCVPPTVEQEQDKVQQSQDATLLGTAGVVAAAAMVAVPVVATSLPALTPLGVYSYATTALTTAPALAPKALTVVGATSFITSSVACFIDPNSDLCTGLIVDFQADPTGVYALANATDDLLNAGVQSVNNYLNQQVDDVFDGLDSLGYGYQASNYDFVGNSDSLAVNDISLLALDYMNNYQLDELSAIAIATNDVMPPYYPNFQPGTIPADSVKSLDELLDCDGVVCRHYTQMSTAVAENLGLEADFVQFSLTTSEGVGGGHAVTLVKNLDGSFSVIDATKPSLTNSSIENYIQEITNLGFTPTGDFQGAIYGFDYQINP
jgi:hypothetical protein